MSGLKQLSAWVHDMQVRVPALTMFAFDTRTEPQRSMMPNAWLLHPSERKCGLLIELAPMELTRRQDWRDPFRRRGYRAEICVGWVRAARLIVEYLEPTLTPRERQALYSSIPMS